MGTSAVAVVLLATVGFGIYNYRYSPKALAEQLVNRGLTSISFVSGDKLTSINTSLGGDPKEALEEAKRAKDLRILSKEAYEKEMKDYKGAIIGGSLSSDPNAPSFGMATVNASGEGMSGPVTIGASGSMSGQSSSQSGAVNGGITYGTLTLPEGQTMPAPPAVVESEPSFRVEKDGESSSRNDGGYTVSTSDTVAVGIDPQTEKLTNIKMPIMETPSSYLRYTNSEGQVVVLSLNADGVPFMKSILLKPESLGHVQIKHQ